jgi:hypothetical protein
VKSRDPPARPEVSIILTTIETGYGPSREPRRVELNFRDGDEATFMVSADLREAYSDGEGIV